MIEDLEGRALQAQYMERIARGRGNIDAQKAAKLLGDIARRHAADIEQELDDLGISDFSIENTPAFGSVLNALRVEKKWSMNRLGREAKLSRQAISMIERERLVPAPETVERLAEALNAEYSPDGHLLRIAANESRRQRRISR